MIPEGFSIYDMLVRNAQVFAKRPALIHANGTQTFSQLLERVDALATGLLGHDLNKGDRVCILAQNHAAYVELYFACAKLGLIAYPINWRLSVEEIALIVERADPRMMVVDEFTQSQVAQWPGQKKSIPHWAQFGNTAGESFIPFNRLYIESGAEPVPEIAADEGFAVISTAAVDIVPRGALLTHANLIASNIQSQALMGLVEDDVYLIALPLYHISALANLLAVMHAGGAGVIMTRFDADEAVRLVDLHKVTFFNCFAPVLENTLAAASKAGSKLASIRHASGLENPEAIKQLIELTGATFWAGFGQSETTGFVSLQRLGEKPGAAGRPAPLCRIRLVDEDGQDVPTGEPGEIIVRGPVVMKGYYGQPEVTAHTFRGGWHHTGDLGKFDADGYLYYAGRKPEKELIKPGGENVYPAEVERVIAELDGVKAVCVFGVPDQQWGEAIKAIVETEGGLEAQAVIDHVGGRIARFKKPKFVEFTNALPRTASGEVDRPAVKAQWG